MDLEMEMQIEPIVSKDEIRRRAFEAAERQQPIHDANPYPEGCRSRLCFELAYWEKVRDLEGETSM